MRDAGKSFILTINCPDTIGIVAAVAGFLSERRYFIETSSHFGDPDTRMFFMRTRFSTPDESAVQEDFARTFAAIAEQFAMHWQLFDPGELPRVLIVCSKHEHCVNDLLYRYRTGALQMTVPAIVSNHDLLRPLAGWHNIPFHHVPVTAATKPAAEQQLLDLIAETQADLVVLARYMQILSDDLCQRMVGRIINIHHSFLPGFKGARPYHKAHEHGVKLIGATAHYVSPALDEGPIIEQMVERVDHSHSVDDLVAVGRDVESITLARAVRLHLEHRVFLNGNKTVVFR